MVAGRDAAAGQRARYAMRALVMLAIPAALLLVSGLIAGLPASGSEIERGVRVGGVDLLSGDRSQVMAQLDARFATFLEQPMTFRLGNRVVEADPAELGLRFDTAATYERALGVGRGGTFSAGAERLAAHTWGVDITPVFTYDASQLARVLSSLGDGAVVAPANATFQLQGNALIVSPSSEGTGIDSRDVERQLRAVVGGLTSDPIEARIITVKPTTTTAALESITDQAVQALSGTVYLSDNGNYWQITPQALASAITVRDKHLALNPLVMDPMLDTLAPAVKRDQKDAAIVLGDDGTFRIDPDLSSRELDLRASRLALQQALLDGERQVPLVVNEKAPKVTAAVLQPLLDRATEIAGRGMIVTWPDGEQALDGAAFAGTLRFDPDTQTVTVDQDAMFQVIEPVARAVSRPATGYRWKDWAVVAPEGALPGRTVDIAASVRAVTRNTLGGEGRTALVVDEQKDPASGESAIVINEALASASTYYGNSSYNRATNVEVAAAALDGALVAPGGTFSFNNAIGGTASLDDGYQVGFGIVAGENGVPRTVPSVAGGICQVSTTVFQAAFWAGMPIGTRNWHLYWIPNYGNGPGGLTGLDATVEPDYGLDFTFYNPTDSWLAVRAVADGEWLTVELWGTSQGWQVQADDPVISNVVKADPTMVYQQSDQLGPGEQIFVEHAEDGFSAAIHRVVKDKDGNVIDDTTFNSYYQPSRNVTLVGPSVSIPELAPDPAPAPPAEGTAPPVEQPVTPAPEPTAEPAGARAAESVPAETVVEETPTPAE
ncbi:MAG TPA: VanW family protein [Thermomicrobiales bacterium]|nr:VanW family protein [Thermomicrobiales bacterium]